MRETDKMAGATVATRLAFLAAGFAMACWAPLVPFAKLRTGANDAQLGLILLCLGIGSLIAMPLTGWLSARIGSKPMIIGGGVGLAVLLPALGGAPSAQRVGLALLGFGAALGTLDVAMNVHGVEVERRAGRPLMSGFHAMFSVGGFVGAGVMTGLLSAGLAPLTGATLAGAATLVAIAGAIPRLLPARGTPARLVVPHGYVVLLAGLTAVAFLTEGALLDWGALFVIDARLAAPAQAGYGYVAFSVAMTAGRLAGDRLVQRVGNRRVVAWGGAAAVGGFVLLLTAREAAQALGGFVAIGLGASNVVPVLFRLAARQSVMPAGLAVAALTTTGYAGVLAGPAAIGFLSHEVGLHTTFWLLAALMAAFPLCAAYVARGAASPET